MPREKKWFFIFSLVILVISITGVCLAVTPVAASFPQANSIPYAGALATTLHDQGPDPTAVPAPASSQPSTVGCLLCYSPSHNLLTRLSGWMGK
jgi:hypothetical protein